MEEGKKEKKERKREGERKHRWKKGRKVNGSDLNTEAKFVFPKMKNGACFSR